MTSAGNERVQGPSPSLDGLSPSSCATANARRASCWPVLAGLLTGIVCGAIAAGVAWWAFPPEYTAVCYLHVREDPMPRAGKNSAGVPSSRYLQDQVVLVQSNFVLAAALTKPGIASLRCVSERRDPVEWLRDRLEVGYPANGEILRIALRGKDGEESVCLLRAVRDAYFEEVIGPYRDSLERRLKLLRQSCAQNAAQISAKESELQAIYRRFEVGHFEQAMQKSIQVLDETSALRSRIGEVQAKLSGLDTRISLLQARLEKIGSEESLQAEAAKQLEQRVQSLLAQDPRIVQARRQADSLQAALEAEKLRAGRADAPSLVRLQEWWNSLEEELARREGELRPQLTAQAAGELARQSAQPSALARREQLLAAVADAELDKAVLEEESRLTKESFAAEARRYEALMEVWPELQSRQEELSRLKRLSERMEIEAEQWEIQLQAPPPVSVLEDVHVPPGVPAVRQALQAGMIGLIGFVIPLLAVPTAALLFRRRR